MNAFFKKIGSKKLEAAPVVKPKEVPPTEEKLF